MKYFKKSVAALLCGVMLICSLSLSGTAAGGAEDGRFIFGGADSLSYVSDVNNLDCSFNKTEKSLQLKVNSSAADPDPHFSIDMKKIGVSLSASTYKYMVLTYRTPASVSDKANACEVFLSAGSVAAPTAGKSVVFAAEKSGKYIAKILDLSSLDWWSGDIHSIRIDPYCGASYGDVMLIDSVILCKTSVAATAVATNRVKSAYDASSPYSGTDYVCTAYDVTKYTSPLWKGNIVYNEAVYPVEDASGNAVYTLMYTPDNVMCLYSADFSSSYTEGIDFTVSGNKLTILKSGAIPLKKYSYIHRDYADGYRRTAAGDGLYEYWGQSKEFFNGYLNITYTHSDAWSGPVPEDKSAKLPNTAEQIRNKGSLNIVYFGDSICGGANASSYRNVYPYAEWWNEQISSELSKGFGVNVKTTISSVGGSTASDMVSSVQESVINHDPDLVFIEYGVNDAMNASQDSDYNAAKLKSEFKSGIDQMIQRIRASLPKCEIVLVAPFYSNPFCHYMSYFEACRDALCELEAQYSGVAVADVTAMHKYLLTFKDYLDTSGDNMCHPNDFMSRVFSQVCLETIVPGGVSAYEPKDEPRDPDAPENYSTSAAPGGHGWYWPSSEAYGHISGYGTNGQDIDLSVDLCLLPSSETSMARLWTADGSHISITPIGITLGGKTYPYSWGGVSVSNWHRVRFVIKDGAAAVYIDGEEVARVQSGIVAYTDYQMLFSQYGEMYIDNIEMRSSSGKEYFSCDFENEAAAKKLFGSGLGQYAILDANTVSYDLCGGSGDFRSQVKAAGKALPLYTAKPERENYTFMGWAETKNAASPDYAAGAKFEKEITAPLTLYAIWRSDTASAPVIESVTPASASITDSGSVSYTMIAVGEGLSYAWQSTDALPDGVTLSGTDTQSLTVTVPEKLKASFTASFICTVTSDGGSAVSDPVTLSYTSTYLAGDINGDGKVNGKDLTRLAKYFTDKSTAVVKAAIDANGDGMCNASDLNVLMRYIAGAEITIY